MVISIKQMTFQRIHYLCPMPHKTYEMLPPTKKKEIRKKAVKLFFFFFLISKKAVKLLTAHISKYFFDDWPLYLNIMK
jgi:hypothetical protein